MDTQSIPEASSVLSRLSDSHQLSYLATLKGQQHPAFKPLIHVSQTKTL